MVNLVKFLASSGIASRRESEKIIRSGRVCVNGNTMTNPAHRIADGETVTCDGKIISAVTGFKYILLHKPRGYVCSNADKHADKLAVELLSGIQEKMVSAGRLDKDSEGAIIFSNDGGFINHLTHPRFGILKTYTVHTAGDISDKDMMKIQNGIEDDGEILKAHSVRKINSKCYEFILNEGKKREIRRLTAACHAPTVRLIRIKIGNVCLGDLPEGEFRELSAEEINSLKGCEI